VRGLPWHHRDPFDRLLIANAVEQGFRAATRDEAIAADDVGVLRG
jgi:PIN domain nuclease of toxin-antitoxin system